MANRDQNKAPLADILTEAFAEKKWATWEREFSDYGITCGVIAKTQDVSTDEQVQAANMLVTGSSSEGHAHLDSPYFVAGVKKSPPRQAPVIGQHSKEILSGLGISETEVSKLEQQGVISGP